MIVRASTWTTALIATCVATLSACGPADGPDGQLAQVFENPAAARSAEPRLTRSADGHALLSWVSKHGDDTHVLNYSSLTSVGWDETREIARGDNWFVNWADFPGVWASGKNLLAAHWLERNGESTYAYGVRLSFSTDGGTSWSQPFWAHSDGTATEHGFVSSYPSSEGIGLAWLDGRAMAGAGHEHGETGEAAMQLRFAEFNASGVETKSGVIDDRVCDCCQTGIASDRGEHFLVYRDRSYGEVRDIAFSQYRDGQWPAGRVVSEDNWVTDACPVNGPAIDVNGKAVAYAWFTQADGVAKIRLARSADQGRSFSETDLSAAVKPLGRVAIEVLHDGRIVVSWVERIEGGKAALKAQMFGLHGQANAPVIISEVAASYSTGFPQMLRLGNELIFAWTASGDAGSQVRTARLALRALL